MATDNRQFSQLSGRTDAVERPVMPVTDEEREIVREERKDLLGEELGGDAFREPEGQVDEYTGDPAGEDYTGEIERESGGKG
jgi:hypothetical protein